MVDQNKWSMGWMSPAYMMHSCKECGAACMAGAPVLGEESAIELHERFHRELRDAIVRCLPPGEMLEANQVQLDAVQAGLVELATTGDVWTNIPGVHNIVGRMEIQGETWGVCSCGGSMKQYIHKDPLQIRWACINTPEGAALL